MCTPGEKKNRNFQVVRGGQYASRARSPEEQFEHDIRVWAARGRVDGEGRIASNALYDIGEGKRHPGRIIARIIGDAMEKGALPVWAAEFGEMSRRYVERKAAEMGAEMGLSVEQPDRVA